MNELLLDVHPLEFRNVFRCLGYGSGPQPHPEVIDMVRDYTEEALQLGCIPGAFMSFPLVKVDEEGVTVEKGKIFSRKLAGIARGAERIAFGLVSAGRRFDEQLEASDGLLSACVRDAVGTVLVEEGVDRLLAKISAETKLRASLPFSPGYCDWDLGGQELIFSAFPPCPIGISLVEGSLMMVPQKSISFVVCLGSRMETVENPCRYCTLKNCFMRR